MYTKLHDGKSGYFSQSALPLYFGLVRRALIARHGVQEDFTIITQT